MYRELLNATALNTDPRMTTHEVIKTSLLIDSNHFRRRSPANIRGEDDGAIHVCAHTHIGNIHVDAVWPRREGGETAAFPALYNASFVIQ